MAKWLSWEMTKVGVNQQTFIGTIYVLGNELSIQDRMYCFHALEADRTSPYNGNR